MKTIILNNRRKDFIKVFKILSKGNYRYSATSNKTSTLISYTKKITYIIDSDIYKLVNDVFKLIDNTTNYDNAS